MPPISSSTGSEETFKIANTWLKSHEKCLHDCTENTRQHETAHEGIPLINLTPEVASSQTHTLPTRLVDVRSDKFKLRLSSEILATGYGDQTAIDTRYIALSHCWAGDPFLTLTEARPTLYRRRGSFSSMSDISRRDQSHSKTRLFISMDRFSMHYSRYRRLYE